MTKPDDFIHRKNLNLQKLFKLSATEPIRKEQEILQSINRPSAFEILKREQERIQDLFKSPATEAIRKEQEFLHNINRPSAFEILKREQEIFQDLFKSQATEVIRRKQEILQSIDRPSAFEILKREQERIQDLFKSPATEAIRREQEILQSMLTPSIFDSFQQLKNMPFPFSGISAITEILNKESFYPEVLKKIEESFSLSMIRDLELENVSFDNKLEAVKGLFFDKVEKIHPGLISFEGMMQLFFAIFIFIYSTMLSTGSEKKILEKIDQMQVHVIEKIHQLKPSEEVATYYIVERAVNLHSNDNIKSPIISILYPNQRVELIQRRNKWIYVRYFDYLDGIPRMGWGYKKYLKMER